MPAIAAANIAISINHLLFAACAPIFVFWLIPWSWPDWAALAVFVGPMLALDAIIWPLVYRAIKYDAISCDGAAWRARRF